MAAKAACENFSDSCRNHFWPFPGARASETR